MDREWLSTGSALRQPRAVRHSDFDALVERGRTDAPPRAAEPSYGQAFLGGQDEPEPAPMVDPAEAD
jgi:hypothetical protein